MAQVKDLDYNARMLERLRSEDLQDLRRRCENAMNEIDRVQQYVRSSFPRDGAAANACRSLGGAKRYLRDLAQAYVRDYERFSEQLERDIRS